ncbi:hypothetical protein [Stutzerimonas frequens]|uniref:Uncharacterized protein n=1 Tax=Stutzerimonas frequens TaxID=2968969 RepID=A0AA47DZT1_9GAMM|nr:hypothetical protein [Stutzerimonas frequens]WAE51218.1 hypothetical protein OSV15_16245 [Stutzerimonas frequens]
MSKVLVDRELLELLRNFTFLHDDGCAGALRGRIDRSLAAQPAEAEGVEVVATVHIGDPCPETGAHDDLELLPEDCEFYDGECLIRQTDHLAALSAVTAERDRLLSDNASLRGSCKALGEENKQLKRENKRQGRTIAAMAAREAEPEHVCSGCGAKGWTGNCLACIPY